jgi:hypothetical protein
VSRKIVSPQKRSQIAASLSSIRGYRVPDDERQRKDRKQGYTDDCVVRSLVFVNPCASLSAHPNSHKQSATKAHEPTMTMVSMTDMRKPPVLPKSVFARRGGIFA